MFFAFLRFFSGANKTRSRISLKNPAFPLMSSEGRDRTKKIQKQEVLDPMVRPGVRVH